jgi:flagellar motor switch protein FliN/FliY
MTDKENMNWTIEALYEVPVQISVVLGSATMQLSNLLKLGKGAVIELNRTIGEPIDIFVNNKLVAKGEVVVVENKIGVTLTEIIKTEKELN